MKTKVAVACKCGVPLPIETIERRGRKFAEALVAIKTTRTCPPILGQHARQLS